MEEAVNGLAAVVLTAISIKSRLTLFHYFT